MVSIHWPYSTDLNLKFRSLAECLSILEVDYNARFMLLVKPTTTSCGNAVAPMKPSQQNPAVCPSLTLSYPSPTKGHHYGTAPFN